jgi:hypothetical protein
MAKREADRERGLKERSERERELKERASLRLPIRYRFRDN